MKIPIKLQRDRKLAIGLAIAILVGIFMVVSPAALYFYVSELEGSLVKAYILGLGLELMVAFLLLIPLGLVVALVSVCEDIIKHGREENED